MTSDPDQLDIRQVKAASAIARGDQTYSEIAAQAGITDRQLRAWRRLPAFSDLVQDLVSAERTRAHRCATFKARTAILRLVEIVESPDSKPGAVVSAARVLLETAGLLRGGVTADPVVIEPDPPQVQYVTRISHIGEGEGIHTERIESWDGNGGEGETP